MKLNIRQKKVVEATENKILCLAAAAAGKTRTLTERIRHLIETRKVDPSKIVAITFTNMAAEEMKKRLGNMGDKCFIGTIHSYSNKICMINGIDTISYLTNCEFDEVLKKAILLPRSKYQEIEHLLVDECQDLSPLEYSFLNKIPTKNIFYIGDNRQMIYTFRGSTDEFLRNMYLDDNFKKYYLVENYRNAPNIMKYADSFLYSFDKLSPQSISVKTKEGIIEECTLPEAIEELKLSENWGSWFVLTRTNNELAEIQEILDKEEIPNVTFKKGDLDTMQLDELMASNRVKVLTIHSCMSGDTLVPTSKGIMTIKEIVEQADPNMLVYNGKYYDKVKDFINNGKELTYKITSKCGSSIRLTENHDVIILDNNGLKKVKVKDLQGKENILLRKNISNYMSNQIKMQSVNDNEIYHNVTHYPFPLILTEELAELVGMITADGSHNTTSIHYMKRHKECVERFAELIKKCFNKEIEVKRCSDKDAWFSECNSRFILTYLYKNFDGIENNNKFISSQILQSEQSIQCAFLRGLFEDGTVGIKKEKVDNITLTFKNPAMITQLQTLLFTLGIDASFTTHIYEGKNPLNYCYIYSTGISAFKEKIGFISKFKQDRLNTFEQKYQRKNKSSVFREMMLAHKDELYIKGQARFWCNLVKNQSLTDGAFFKYYNLLNEEQKQKDYIILIKDIFENYLVEEIASIVPYKEEDTYCLTMEHESQFIQNGFLMGNSKGLENKNVIVTGARLYNEEERKIAYVAATRAENALYWCPSFMKRYKKGTGLNKKAEAGRKFEKSSQKMVKF